MRKIKIVQWIALLALSVTACTAIPVTGGQSDAKDEMMAEPTSTSVMMEEATHSADDGMESGNATPDAMADPMMEKETPAADAMMDKGTSTPELDAGQRYDGCAGMVHSRITDVSYR